MASKSTKLHDEIWELACNFARVAIRTKQDWTEVRSLPSSFRVLLLIDMNGTLLYRSKTPLNGPYVHVFNNTYYYHRPHVRKFLQWLQTYRSWIDIAFYTSMTHKNAEMGANHLLKNMKPIYIYDQAMNKSDPEGPNHWSMMRDLPRIWSTENSPGYGHSERTTIMIDDSLMKMREYPDNAIIIPEFSESMVQGGDDVLEQLQRVLQLIFAEAVISRHRYDFDIRCLLKAHEHELVFDGGEHI